MQDVLGTAGAVEALLAAIRASVGMPGAQPDGSAGGIEALQAQQLLGGRPSSPDAAAALAEALQALQFCCLGHDGNVARLAVAGGLDAVRAALLAAGTLWATQEHGAVLLALLGGRQDSSPSEMSLCVRLVVDIAEQQLDKKCAAMPAVLHCLLTFRGCRICQRSLTLLHAPMHRSHCCSGAYACEAASFTGSGWSASSNFIGQAAYAR